MKPLIESAGREARGAGPGDAGRGRNVAFDLVKGTLVLLMVLYHWINYFISVEGWFYKYIRFVTPSFILITGFFISNIYLSRYAVGDRRLHLRLAERGLKLLLMFTLLNLALAVMMPPDGAGGIKGLQAFFRGGLATYVTGNGSGASFWILVPISYVLLSAAVLLLLCKMSGLVLPVGCGMLLAAALGMGLVGSGCAMLELFAIGWLGVFLGTLPLPVIDRWVCKMVVVVVIAYLGYLMVLTLWREVYLVQVVGVCVSMLLLYALALRVSDRGAGASAIQLLGRYSLLAYIGQIAVLVGLAAVTRRVGIEGMARLVVSFAGAFVLTYAMVRMVDVSRARWSAADRMYRVIFA